MKNELISAMIVEDSHEARLLLEKYLADYPFIRLVASAKSVDEATLVFLKHRPELVFLDVELDDRTGFEFLENIRDLTENLKVIFTTAYDHYAVNAIKHSAFDYLLKPIDPAELAVAIEKVHADREMNNLEQRINSLEKVVLNHRKLRFNMRSGSIFIHPDDIVYIHADWNYSDIYLSKQKHELISMNLGSIQDLLPKETFVRINRSIIINKSYISKIQTTKRICYLVKNGEEYTFPVSASNLHHLH